MRLQKHWDWGYDDTPSQVDEGEDDDGKNTRSIEGHLGTNNGGDNVG